LIIPDIGKDIITTEWNGADDRNGFRQIGIAAPGIGIGIVDAKVTGSGHAWVEYSCIDTCT
jgi:hypothetical protein